MKVLTQGRSGRFKGRLPQILSVLLLGTLTVPGFAAPKPVFGKLSSDLRKAAKSGEMIDVIATERGIAINPRRQDLLDAVKGSRLPIRPIQDIKAEVEKICGGKPARPRFTERPVAIVKWVDGSVLDTVWQLA